MRPPGMAAATGRDIRSCPKSRRLEDSQRPGACAWDQSCARLPAPGMSPLMRQAHTAYLTPPIFHMLWKMGFLFLRPKRFSRGGT